MRVQGGVGEGYQRRGGGEGRRLVEGGRLRERVGWLVSGGRKRWRCVYPLFLPLFSFSLCLFSLFFACRIHPFSSLPLTLPSSLLPSHLSSVLLLRSPLSHPLSPSLTFSPLPPPPAFFLNPQSQAFADPLLPLLPITLRENRRQECEKVLWALKERSEAGGGEGGAKSACCFPFFALPFFSPLASPRIPFLDYLAPPDLPRLPRRT